MSKENLDQFIQQISEREELQARIGEEIDADSLIALGAEHGCEFTADDLTAGAELSDEMRNWMVWQVVPCQFIWKDASNFQLR